MTSAQGGQASPAATATGKIGEATITITYSSPGVKGRTIWGELVPYDKVWRAGANQATIFETDKDITIEGKLYSVLLGSIIDGVVDAALCDD